MATLSVDLSTLDGWSSVEDGTHILKVVSKASGYKNSTGATISFTKDSSWIDPVQSGEDVYIQQVYSASQSDDTMTIE